MRNLYEKTVGNQHWNSTFENLRIRLRNVPFVRKLSQQYHLGQDLPSQHKDKINTKNPDIGASHQYQICYVICVERTQWKHIEHRTIFVMFFCICSEVDLAKMLGSTLKLIFPLVFTDIHIFLFHFGVYADMIVYRVHYLNMTPYIIIRFEGHILESAFLEIVS